MPSEPTAANEPDYGAIDVPATPTTDEEIAKLPVLDLDAHKASAAKVQCDGGDGPGCQIPHSGCVCEIEGTPGYRRADKIKPTPTPAAGLLSLHTGTFKAGE